MQVGACATESQVGRGNLVIIVVSQHKFFLIRNQNYRRQLFFKLLLWHVHGVVVKAIKLRLNL